MEISEDFESFDWQRLWRMVGAMPAMGDELNAVLNGGVGDRLQAEGCPLAIEMQLLLDGRPVDSHRIDAASVSSRLAIFVPGLMAGPRFWSVVGREPMPERLAADRGLTSIILSYNTGLHVSTNGRQLAALIQELVDGWPVEVDEINLVGHSMGGLVSRSASHYAHEQSLPWIRLLRRMILLGTPSRGATLEQLANVAAFTLRCIPNPWTWLISWVFRQRSAGIKDLRHGYLVDEEWQGRDPDSLTTGRRHLVPLLPQVEHYVAAGSLFEDEQHPLSKIIGDAMVPPYSAKDEGFDGTPGERAPTAARFFPGMSHPAVAGHDEVYAQLLEWWGPQPEASAESLAGKA